MNKKLRALLSRLPIERFRNPPPVVAVVSLRGVIGGVGPFRRGLTLPTLAGLLERAFRLSDVKAVALAINSPGGAAVQSALIATRIRALAEEHKVPVLAFAEDVAASGGYWLATAADEIYADESSIIGSIGVISAGFGFPEALKRLGIERRVYTAGEHKNPLDPFLPEQPDELDHLKRLQADVHEAFCRQVRARRGDRLQGDEEIFSGRFWSGKAALERGLIDGIGDLRGVLRHRFGEKVRLRLMEDGRRWWQRRFGLPRTWTGAGRGTAPGMASELAGELIAGIEERAWWSRFGL
ncbi:MAG: S49 family peptidase [Rhodospirillales bacterium]